ncbi:MAG: hypothetical protein RIG68_05945 [Imperialibacter sp.]|uniref:hypothetical protein n=1 Tax=Imperialibacter sp. TaxID=2038411 RepID=UPI0032EF1133
MKTLTGYLFLLVCIINACSQKNEVDWPKGFIGIWHDTDGSDIFEITSSQELFFFTCDGSTVVSKQSFITSFDNDGDIRIVLKRKDNLESDYERESIFSLEGVNLKLDGRPFERLPDMAALERICASEAEYFGDDVTSSPEEPESNMLTIVGNDIWIRDKAGTGEVVMKLNNGDKCKIVSDYPKQFEVIRGDPDYWYFIEFEGKNGWVFGSQTSLAVDIEPLTGTSADDLWTAFKGYHKKSIEVMNSKRTTEDFGVNEYEEINSDEFNVVYADEDGFATSYRQDDTSPTDLMLVNRTDNTSGAAGWYTFWWTHIGMKDGDHFLTYTNDSGFYYSKIAFQGRVEKVVKSSDYEYLLLTLWDNGTGTVCCRQTHYNVIYVNLKEKTIRAMMTEIGFVGYGFMYTEEVDVGELLNTGSMADLDDEGMLSVTEFKSKKQEDGSLMASDTVQMAYKWNKKTKVFTIQ